MDEQKIAEESGVAEETKEATASDAKNEKKKLKKQDAQIAELQKQLEGKRPNRKQCRQHNNLDSHLSPTFVYLATSY